MITKVLLTAYFSLGFYFCISAQIVDIPDVYLKQKLVAHDPVIDTNGDNEIQLSEAQNFTGTLELTYIAGDPGQIENMTGLEAFSNIETLNAGYNAIAQIDLSSNTELRIFNASGNLFTFLDFSNNPHLEFVQSNNGNLNSINIQNNPQLQWLHIQNNELTELNTLFNPLLQGINIDNNPINSLNFQSNTILVYLNCRATQLQHLELQYNPNLLAVDCSNNLNLQYLNIKNGNNDGLNITGVGASCEFSNLPVLETVCLDDVNSAFAGFIISEVGHSFTITEECLLDNTAFNEIQLKAYPNPFRDELTIQSNSVIYKTRLFNILGQEILSHDSQDSLITLQPIGLHSGIYILQVILEGNEVKLFKLVKSEY